MNQELADRLIAQLQLAQDLAGAASQRLSKLNPENISASKSVTISHSTNALNACLRCVEVVLDEVEAQNIGPT
jgi:hypothetical protein